MVKRQFDVLGTLAVASLLLLPACGRSGEAASVRFDALMTNPLFADQYWTDLTNSMVDIQLHKEAGIVDNDAKSKQADAIRKDAAIHEQAVARIVHSGRVGSFIPVKDHAEGSALIQGSTLFLSPGFATSPGPSLHLYLTTVADPRDGTFPDSTSIDLGLLQSPYGTQQYATAADKTIRTVVLYDTTLQRIHGFAQLQ